MPTRQNVFLVIKQHRPAASTFCSRNKTCITLRSSIRSVDWRRMPEKEDVITDSRTYRRKIFRRRTLRRRTDRRTDTSPFGHFADRTFRREDTSPYGHFTVRTLRRKDTLPWDFLLFGHFAVNYVNHLWLGNIHGAARSYGALIGFSKMINGFTQCTIGE